MNINRILVFALIGAVAMTGCVSIQTLEKDLKSNDSTKQSTAKQDLVRAVTKGKVGFSTFNTKDRLWCAKHITDKGDILNVIEKMSLSDLSECNNLTSPEVVIACKGFYHDDNAPILEILFDNLGADKDAMSILTRDKVLYKRKVYDVAVRYAKLYINSITEIDGLVECFSSFQDSNLFEGELRKRMDPNDIIPSRMTALVSGPNEIIKIIKFYEASGSCISEKVFKAAVSKVKGQKDLISLYWSLESSWLRRLTFEYITDSECLSEIALKEGDYGIATKAVEKINDMGALIRIALFANHTVVRAETREKVGDAAAMMDERIKAIKANNIKKEDVEFQIDVLRDGEATIALYNAVQDESLKQKVFDKLSGKDRKVLRSGNSAQGKELIAKAKGKAKETFEMGGFYLGMDITDANRLIVYYFPEWLTEEGFEDKEKTIRVVWVPQQQRAFCRADKNGKVWQFNFGKKILKKFCKYDVQNEQEWARAYSKEHGIDMKPVFLNQETAVVDVSGSLDFTTYKAWLHQDTWQWKNNAQNYRLIYYAEPNVETVHGNIVKQMAMDQFRYVSSDRGTLRVSVDND